MAISYVGAAAATAGSSSTTTTATAALPTGIAAGDLLILAVHRTSDYPLTSTTPSGWVFIRNILDTGASPNAGQTDLYYRYADGTETTTGPTFTTASTTRWILHCGAYRGGSPTYPFVAEGAATQTFNVATHASPSLTNTDPAAWTVFAVLARGASPASWTPDPALTERLDTDLGTTNSSNIYAEWSDSATTVAADTYTYAATASAASNIGTHWLAFLASDRVAIAGATATASASTAGGTVTAGATITGATATATATARAGSIATWRGLTPWTATDPWAGPDSNPSTTIVGGATATARATTAAGVLQTGSVAIGYGYATLTGNGVGLATLAVNGVGAATLNIN